MKIVGLFIAVFAVLAVSKALGMSETAHILLAGAAAGVFVLLMSK